MHISKRFECCKYGFMAGSDFYQRLVELVTCGVILFPTAFLLTRFERRPAAAIVTNLQSRGVGSGTQSNNFNSSNQS